MTDKYKKKILVIEDEPPVRNNLLILLKAEGFDALAAVDGLAGLQLAQTHLPDLILCDIMMPNLDGYGVITALRSSPETASIPFIFLSAKADRSDLRQGMELGADDYLTKPFTRVELLGAIAARFERQVAINQPYSTPPLPAAERLNDIQTSLRHALERREFQPYYQPQIDLHTGKIMGAEVLLRWLHPRQGLVSPLEFIPLAEETGWIIPIGEWVLHTACTQAKAWQIAGLSPLQIAVNLSARQFNQPNLRNRVLQILQETNLEPRYLELELTESTIVENPKIAIQIMSDFKNLGIEISIDDFGTGYSSLNYLKQFPFNTLKIDRLFVSNINNDAKNAAITTAITQMAHTLNLKVIAEGVETQAELSFLCQHNCDAAQGYLFSRPIPAGEFEKMLVADKIWEINAG